jgi:hypothetical protein
VGFTASHGPDHLRIYEIEVEGQHGLCGVKKWGVIEL